MVEKERERERERERLKKEYVSYYTRGRYCSVTGPARAR